MDKGEHIMEIFLIQSAKENLEIAKAKFKEFLKKTDVIFVGHKFDGITFFNITDVDIVKINESEVSILLYSANAIEKEINFACIKALVNKDSQHIIFYLEEKNENCRGVCDAPQIVIKTSIDKII